MVTMDYPVSGVNFNGVTNAFLEDWLSTGANQRRFEMKEGFKRKTDGTWIGMTQVTFTRNNEAYSSNYTNNNDAGTLAGGYYMQSGGSTNPSYAGTPPITLNSNPGASSSNPAIAFSITGVTTSSVTWSVPESSTP